MTYAKRIRVNAICYLVDEVILITNNTDAYYAVGQFVNFVPARTEGAEQIRVRVRSRQTIFTSLMPYYYFIQIDI